MKTRILPLVVGLILATASGASWSADPSPIDPLRAATLKLIEALVEQGILTREKADALIKEASQPSPAPVAATPAPANAAAANGTASPGEVRVPYVPQFVRDQLKEEIRQDLLAQAKQDGWAPPGSVPDWVRTLKWEGDLRIRFENDAFASGNAPAVNPLATNNNRALTLLNTTETTDRERVRARAGFTADIDDETSAGFRLATGSATDPLSENQTLGNYETRYTVAVDRAYLQFRPYPGFSATFGRFANPLVATDLVWAPDLSFDGIALKYSRDLGQGTRPFILMMASPVQEIDLGSANKYLFSTQGGIQQNWGQDTNATIALGYYRYTGIEGVVSPLGTSLYEYTAPAFTQKGNTYYNISSDPTRPLLGLASAYRLADLTATLDTVVNGPYHAILTADYVKNLGFDEAAVSARVGQNVQPKTVGYLVRGVFGDPELKARNDWQLSLTYKHVERDAVLDAFTDPDFHLGGTDAKGYVFGASYGLAKNTWATLRYFSTDSINGPPLSIDQIQFDLNTRF